MNLEFIILIDRYQFAKVLFAQRSIGVVLWKRKLLGPLAYLRMISNSDLLCFMLSISKGITFASFGTVNLLMLFIIYFQ